jgi:hypothetical protein
MTNKKNDNKKNLIITIVAFFGIVAVCFLLYVFLFTNKLSKKTVETIPEKNSSEEIVKKFVDSSTTIGLEDSDLEYIFGENYIYNRKNRLTACLLAKNYIDNKIYESTCDEGIVNQASKKINNYFTSKPENIKIEIKSKEEVEIDGKKTQKVVALVDFDVIRKNYIVDRKKTTKDNVYVDLIDKKYKVRDAQIVLINNPEKGWTIVDIDDVNNKATDLISTWNSVGEAVKDGEEVGKTSKTFKNEDIVKAVASPKDHEEAKLYGVDDIDEDEIDKSDLRAVDSHHKSN